LTSVLAVPRSRSRSASPFSQSASAAALPARVAMTQSISASRAGHSRSIIGWFAMAQESVSVIDASRSKARSALVDAAAAIASGKKDEAQDQTELTKPGGARSPGAEEEGERENEIADNVENENLPDEGRLIGMPAGRGVEEEEIGGGGNDADLDEIEDAKGIEAHGVRVGTRKEHHEDRRGPDEEQEIGGIRTQLGTGDKTLVVAADGLAQGTTRCRRSSRFWSFS